jgi:saccharopine dehydrogenase-like NADP-dependent oxidoreductase
LVIYGATGFTGTLAAKYVATQYSGGQVKWAVAGRSRSKLEALAAQVCGIITAIRRIDLRTVLGARRRHSKALIPRKRDEKSVLPPRRPELSDLDAFASVVLQCGGCGVIVAEAADDAALAELCTQTKAVAACAGPFARYGKQLVAACVAAGTDCECTILLTTRSLPSCDSLVVRPITSAGRRKLNPHLPLAAFLAYANSGYFLWCA